MKYKFNKKFFIGTLPLIACILLLPLFFPAVKSIVLKSVCYSTATSNAGIETVKNELLKHEYDESGLLFSSIQEINLKGPFSIKSNGEEIFVFHDGCKIYRINALLSEFPFSDKKAIQTGMQISTAEELYEIVSYLES